MQATRLFLSVLVITLFGLPGFAAAQDWGRQDQDDWGPGPSSREEPGPAAPPRDDYDPHDAYDAYDARRGDGTPPRERDSRGPAERDAYSGYDPYATPWSFRVGIGFTNDPTNFLINLELPYAFDRYVSFGPMIQIGTEDDRLLVAPTANLTIRVPDLPGEAFDQFHPSLFTGIGFAYLENDDRGGDTEAYGFLVNFGVGIEYEVSPRLSVGSRMIFNFLPESTLDEGFFYSWEVGGLKLTF